MTIAVAIGVLIAVGSLITGCGGGDGASPTTTAAGTVVTTTTPSDTTSASTTSTSSTTSTTIDPCAPEPIYALADQAIALGRLGPGDGWSTEVADSVFVDRTDSPTQFATDLALQCSVLAMEQAGDDERLLLAAWTGQRRAFVIQSTDPPESAYETAVRFELIWEQPWGEWLEPDLLWAVTLQGGESLVIGVEDFAIGAAAKAWQGNYPEPPSPPPAIDIEAYAWDALENGGALNVGIAQPTNGTLAWLAFSTDLGNVMIATVGPAGSFDPTVSYLTGDETTHVIDGVNVRLTRPGPDDYDAGNSGFSCPPYVWDITATLGTADELLTWLEEFVPTLGC